MSNEPTKTQVACVKRDSPKPYFCGGSYTPERAEEIKQAWTNLPCRTSALSPDEAEWYINNLLQDEPGIHAIIYPRTAPFVAAPNPGDDLVTYMEMARIAISRIPDDVTENMDLSDEEFQRLRDKLQKIMNPE